MKTLVTIILIAVSLVVLDKTVNYVGSNKPKCFVCNEILWTKYHRENSFDVKVCNRHWDKAEFEARENLGGEYLKGRTDMALKQEIHKVILGRKMTYRNHGMAIK